MTDRCIATKRDGLQCTRRATNTRDTLHVCTTHKQLYDEYVALDGPDVARRRITTGSTIHDYGERLVRWTGGLRP